MMDFVAVFSCWSQDVFKCDVVAMVMQCFVVAKEVELPFVWLLWIEVMRNHRAVYVAILKQKYTKI